MAPVAVSLRESRPVANQAELACAVLTNLDVDVPAVVRPLGAGSAARYKLPRRTRDAAQQNANVVPQVPTLTEAAVRNAEDGSSKASQVFWQRRCYVRRGREATEVDDMHSQAAQMSGRDAQGRTESAADVLAEHWSHAHYRDVMHGRSNDQPVGTGSAACQPNIASKRLELDVGRSLPPSLMEFAEELVRESGGGVARQAEIEALEAGSAFRTQGCELRGGGNGCEAHCNIYQCEVDWAQPSVMAYGTPLMELQRLEKWQQHSALSAVGETLAGGMELAGRAEVADLLELIELGPSLAACCHEVPKEVALRLAVRFGEGADQVRDRSSTASEVLQQAGMALFASVAARARDAHGPELLVEALEALQRLGVAERTYIDMLLSALFNWTSRAPLKPPLALRAACALTAVADAAGGLRLAAGSRRAVAAVREAIADNPAMAVNSHVFDVLGDLASGAAWNTEVEAYHSP